MARRTRILIVEDDDASRAVISAVLARNYDITTAANGDDGLAIALSRPRPDLIVTDVMMPGMDGFEMVRHIRGDEEMTYVPVIFLSARNVSADYKHAENLRADNYLTKPMTSATLTSAVETALKHGVEAEVERTQKKAMKEAAGKKQAEKDKIEAVKKEVARKEAARKEDLDERKAARVAAKEAAKKEKG